MDVKCQIEVGDSVNQPYDGFEPLRTGEWWWNIHHPTCSIEGKRTNYSRKGSAVRAARRHAKRFGLQVTEVYEQE